MFYRKHLAGSGDAALDFVRDHDDPMFIAKPPQRAQEIGRGHVEAALPLHRLDDDGRHGFRIDARVGSGYEVNEIGQCLRSGDAVVGLRKFRVIHLGGERTEAALVGHHFAG